ncbi:type I polyketide synthase [Actinokineospora sp.]|uniref:type I polyketide synthase n=1 Tax=Actinokineospora sp. TaxID=1872133 RepID=UPI0040378A66
MSDTTGTGQEPRVDSARDLYFEKHEPVAIVGIGLRFPGGSETPDEFAEFLRAGRSGIGPVPADRWDAAAFSSEDDTVKGMIRSVGGGFLDRIDEFDAAFFDVSAIEAQYTDPQQRMLLETTWEALENANIDPTALRGGNGGVYVGAGSIDYAMQFDQLQHEELDGHLAAGSTLFPMSGRLSYFLGWHGPCMTVDTAGASSLTALHQAVVGLRRGECDIALCAGVNALHNPRSSVILSHANMLSPDSQCKTFDESANGYVRAEGCGAFVLKRLSDAERCGDTILALIRGSAIGQDGDGAGLSVPNGNAQVRVIRAALADAELAPADISYVEAHGIGTALGDPIEMGAINDVFAKSHTKNNPVVVGSVKTNVGHLESVAGIVGVVKAVLQMRDRVIYPHLNFATPSGRIPWDLYPVTVPTECAPWQGESRRAVVNSFGFGGTIATVVLEQAPVESVDPALAGGSHVFTLSAKNRRSLRRQAERFRHHLAEHPDADLGDLCYTGNVGRAHFRLRVAGVVERREQLTDLLDRLAADDDGAGSSVIRKTAFLFSGNETPYPGMGSALYQQFPVYRESIEDCARLFAEQSADSALFTVEYALAQLWLAWGVRPTVMVGTGVGEVVAATVAGLFTLADAVTLVTARARLVAAPGADAVEEFRAAISGISFHETKLTMISALSGKVARRAEISKPDYWARQATESGDFAAGMRTVEKRGAHVFVEIGPSAALTALAKQCVSADDHGWAHCLHPTDENGAAIRATLIELYLAGASVHWPAIHKGQSRRKVTLPSYGFDRKRYWLPINSARIAASTMDASTHHPLLGAEISTPEQLSTGVREFRGQFSPHHPAYLVDHVVSGQVVFPGAGYIEILLALQDAVYGETGRPLTDVRISEPLFLDAERLTEVRTRLTLDTGTVQIMSRVAGKGEAVERCHATATLAARSVDGFARAGRDLVARAAEAGVPEDVRLIEELYPEFAAVGMGYGPHFQRIRSTTRYAADFAIGDLRGQHTGGMENLPPAVLDGALHTIASLLDDGHNYLPIRFGELRLAKKPKSAHLRVLLRLRTAEQARAVGVDLSADLLVLEDGQPVVELLDLGFKRLADSGGRSFLQRPAWLKRSQLAQAVEQPRHVLLVGRNEFTAAERAERAGVRLSFARTAQDADTVLRTEAPTDVCWFWRPDNGPVTEPALRAECERNYRDLLSLLSRMDTGDQRLWLVTERAQWLPGDTVDSAARPAAATLWGFGQTLLAERPELRATLVDLPEGGDPHLVDEWQARDGGEFQLAYRDGNRHVRRLLATGPTGQDDANFALSIREFGRFANIKPVPVEDAAPVDTEIQVRVHAAGLNFKDVLNALGMLKEHAESLGVQYQPQPLGFECAGTVIAAGPAAEFEVGAEVIVNYAGLMQRRVTVPSAAAVRKPARLSQTEAAGLASAYVTAYYALHHLAKIKQGDRILIHAAAGGVGQAAVQLARAAGAEVFATASPHKWPVLRAQGVRHLMNSRTLDFTEQILRETDGAGVDIVLNSLNKDHIPASLRTMAPHGRFVELGKVGVWSPEQVAQAHPQVEYHNFDFSELPVAEVIRLNKEILTAVAGQIADGALNPITTTVYSLDEVEEAFGVLSRGANVGKLVIAFVDQDAPASREVAIRPDRTYLIAGGVGAFGLVTAEKLVSLGARRLALVSRTGAPPAEVAALLDRLRDRAEVTLYQGDVGNADDVRRINEELAAGPYPVGGVIHAAGESADAPVSAQTWESLDRLFQAKVYGGWLLHEAGESCPHLDFFVAYSGAAALVGGAGQASSAAADAFLDNLVQRRVRGGKPGLGVNWGPMSEVGTSARLGDEHADALDADGIKFFSPAKAMRTLVALLGGSTVQAAVGERDWNRVVLATPAVTALCEELVRAGVEDAEALDLDALAALPNDERLASIGQFVRAKVAQVLHFADLDDLDSHAEFAQMGLDSLVAVELKNALEAAFRIPLLASVAFDHPTARKLAGFIDKQLAPAA